MIVTLVYVQVKPEHVQAFIDATRENHEHSVREKGNVRFDIIQDATDATRFVLYEAYDSEQSAAAHKETAHYFNWRDTVTPWMAKPREGVKHKLLFPEKIRQ